MTMCVLLVSLRSSSPLPATSTWPSSTVTSVLSIRGLVCAVRVCRPLSWPWPKFLYFQEASWICLFPWVVLRSGTSLAGKMWNEQFQHASVPVQQNNEKGKINHCICPRSGKMRVLGVSEGHFQGKKHTHWPDSNKGLQQFILQSYMSLNLQIRSTAMHSYSTSKCTVNTI